MHMRLLRNLAYAALGIGILGLVIWYMATHPAPTPASSQMATSSPDVMNTPTAHITESGTYYKIDAAYPTSAGIPLSNEEARVKASGLIKADVIQEIAGFKSDIDGNDEYIQKLIDSGEEVPESFKNLEFRIDYTTKIGRRTITYILNSYSYTGGAHGMFGPSTYTFDTTTGAALKLGDLFLSGSPYLARLSSIARTDLPAIEGEYANSDFINSGTYPDEVSFGRFYLEGDTLFILFAPYDVAPYVVGVVTLPVKLSRIATILKPEYK